MGLSADLVSQFVKATKDEKKTNTETTVNGTTVIYDGKTYVKIDGSELLTPVKSTASVSDGDKVTVVVGNHTATITGNISDPSASSKVVDKQNSKIAEFEIVMAYKVTTDNLEAVNAAIENLRATAARIENATIINAEIETLAAKFANLEYATITDIQAITANIESIQAKFGEFGNLSVEDMEVVSAEIDKLKGYTADFTYITADELDAIHAEIKKVEAKQITTEELNAKYANIDFANIGEAAIKKLFTDSGIIEDLVVSEGHITGELVGVTIKGSLIEAGTLVADKLVVRGENGIYYKLNLDAGVTSSEEVSEEDLQNGLHGDIIIAKSITAEKVSVDDLVAFGATIGGFEITDDSIHTVAKDSINNTTQGIYLDNEGQAFFGDGNRYLKFFKGTDGKYKLNISADELRFAASGKTVEETINGISIGSRNLLRYTGDLPITYDLTTGIGSYGTAQPLEDTGDGVKFTVPEGGKGGMSIPLIYDGAIRNGEEITISFDYRGNMTDLGAFYFLQRTTPNVSTNIFPDAIVSEEEWQHYEFTFSSNYANDRVCYAALLFYMGSTESGKWIEIKKGSLKLERGNKATDWTPAIEDMVSTGDLNNTKSEITLYVSEQVSNINATASDITMSVSRLDEKITEQLDETIDSIERLQKNVDMKMDSESVKIEIQKIVDNGTSRVDTGMGFTFNDEGLTIDKKDSEGNPISQTNTKITENGMTVNSYATGKAVLTANKDGVDAENLHATTYLIINGKSRFEKYGENRIGCFWIG